MLVYFSSIMKQALFAYVNHIWICSWNQPVLSNEGKVSCSKKQWEILMGFKCKTDQLIVSLFSHFTTQPHCIFPLYLCKLILELLSLSLHFFVRHAKATSSTYLIYCLHICIYIAKKQVRIIIRQVFVKLELHTTQLYHRLEWHVPQSERK